MKAFRTISVVLLASLVMISSTSFMVGIHFCMGEVQNIAILSHADGCEKERELPPCHRALMAPCCEDETIVHDGDNFNVSFEHIQFQAPAVDVTTPLTLISEIIPAALPATTKYFNYDPPLRSCDMTVEHHVFLI